jgi:hypothetical protein
MAGFVEPSLLAFFLFFARAILPIFLFLPFGRCCRHSSVPSSASRSSAVAAAISIATTSAAAAAVSAAATAISTTAAAAAALLTLACFVHRERATVEVGAVHRGNGSLRVFVRSELDEREAARLAGLAIGDDLHLGDAATICSAKCAKRLFARTKGQVTDVNARSHDALLFLAPASDDARGARRA